MNKSQIQSQQYGPVKEGSVINIEAISTSKGKAETGKSAIPAPLAPSIFQATPVTSSVPMSNSTPSFREVIIYHIWYSRYY